jgi:hypothetical protein
VKGIDHLVLAGRDLEAMRDRYRALGFTLTPPARHPFGTGNSLVQLDHCFLELLAVLDPSAIPEPGENRFSFAAFNRDFLADREGFSMLVLDSTDARGDAARLREAGIVTYAPFDFERKAKLPSGQEVTVGFSLAFASHPEMPRAGYFSCQQHAPQHFWKPEYQRHPNTAATILEVCLVASDPPRFQAFIGQFAGVAGKPIPPGIKCSTARGDILILTPQGFAERYGSTAPPMDDGPRLAGCMIGVRDPHFIDNLRLHRVGERWIVPPDQAFGTAIAFAHLKRQGQTDG